MKKNLSSENEFASPGLLRIFAAMAYDSLLLAAVSIAYGAVVLGIYVLIWGAPETGERVYWSLPAKIIISVGWLFLIMMFYGFFWQKFGQTLGMKTWRIQLIDAQTHQGVDWSKAIKRSGFALISLGFLGIGYWFRWFNPQQRLLHDLMSGTQLVLLKKETKR